MTGLELKRKLLGNGIGITDLAGKLGMSQQALSNRFIVKNVKPEFINQIESIIGFSLTEEPMDSATKEFMELLKKKDEQIDRLIALLEKQYGVEREKRNVG